MDKEFIQILLNENVEQICAYLNTQGIETKWKDFEVVLTEIKEKLFNEKRGNMNNCDNCKYNDIQYNYNDEPCKSCDKEYCNWCPIDTKDND